MSTPEPDVFTERLATLFAEQPAWVAAARHLRADATSTVYFRHRAGEAWRLETRDGRTCLLPGAARDPDFVFRFTPSSIEALEAVKGGIGEFAVSLFEQIVEGEVDLRICAGFPRLVMRGYVKLLVAAGPPVLAFGATHGIRTLGALRRFVAELRSRGAADWER